MPKRIKNQIESGEDYTEKPKRKRPKTAMTVEARENQLIALATNKVEERMLNGTASSQEYVHYLRLGATREKQRLENEKLRLELDLVKAKTEAMRSVKQNTELFQEAIKHMTVYQGRGNEEDYDQDLY